MSRPSDYTDELADAICELLADGNSLRVICKLESMPNRSTVFRWLANPDHHVFRAMYAIAREAQADALADDIVSIADEPAIGEITKTYPVWDGKGEDRVQIERTEVRTSDNVDRSRLKIDARKWMAAKLAPKKYGDKLELSSAGGHESALDELERIEREGDVTPGAGASPSAED